MRRLFIFRKDLNMSPGKLSTQVGHAAELYWIEKIKKSKGLYCDMNGIYQVSIEIPGDIYKDYICDIYTKVVCQAKNKDHLLKAELFANEMGFIENEDYGLIYDHCLTELQPEEPDGTTLTGIWFKPLPKETTKKISRHYRIYG